ncbi:MAG: NAD(P)H-dependent oxidoreductase [Treponema sp.]|nr:NAD(P)H-dependent oxidoreductase [Treponema sp.]
MKITLIHGQNHKGSTYRIARMTAEKTGGIIEEFFLPGDLNEGCLGCYACLDKGREFCPHSEKVGKILNSMLSSDVIIIGSPTYVLEMTGHLKNFFDHLFSAWLSHRPEEAMFSKTAVAVSTAAGMGMNGVTKSLARQMFFLGVPKVYRMPVRTAATSWDAVKNKNQITARAEKIAGKIAAKNGKAAAGIKLRLMFSVMRLMQKKNNWAPLDKKYWEDRKWLEKERPWK